MHFDAGDMAAVKTLANRSPVPGKDTSTQGFSVTVICPVRASRQREPV